MQPYQEIAQHYRDRITTGDLTGGQKLPTSRQMALTWDVTRVTVGRAMALLSTEGLVETLGRNGTRVVTRSGVTVDLLVESDDPFKQEFKRLTLLVYQARGYDTAGAHVEILGYGTQKRPQGGETVHVEFQLVYEDGTVAGDSPPGRTIKAGERPSAECSIGS